MAETEHILSATQIKAGAESLGFYACGLAPAGAIPAAHSAFFRQWTAQGCHAGMDYMTRHEEKRLDPRLLAEGCQTVVSVALNYYPATPIPPDRLQLSWYAYGQDYHDVMRAKLQSLLDMLKKQNPGTGLEGRAFCDTAPILERFWAWRCGLGWIGRHTQLVIPRCGSAFFLGELLLNLPADRYDEPLAVSGCGQCTRCREACPTHALSPEGGLDARLCLSYQTVENRRDITPALAEKMYPYFYGCDRCLRACPHLHNASPSTESAFTPRQELLNATEKDWMNLTV